MKIYKMYFKTPLKFNPDVEGIFPRSDTIFAAIANVMVELEGEKVLEELKECRFSSAFPFHKDKLFLPKPLKPPLKERELIKIWKKKMWIDADLINDHDEIVKALKKDSASPFISKDGLYNGICREREIIRNFKDRISERTNIYSVYAIEFERDAGLYFIYSGDVKIDHAVKVLGEEGIGGCKSIGFGKFDVEIKNFKWEEEGKSYLLLSLYLPERSEIEALKNGYYSLLNRTGWSLKREKRMVRVVVEGSVLPYRVNGRILEEYMDGIKIYRNYLALTIPLRW